MFPEISGRVLGPALLNVLRFKTAALKLDSMPLWISWAGLLSEGSVMCHVDLLI